MLPKNIFITGSTGFLGRRFVRELAAAQVGNIKLLIRSYNGMTPPPKDFRLLV